MPKTTPTVLTMVSTPKRVKKDKITEDKVYDLRPDWMKPEFIKNKEEHKQEDNEENQESQKENEENDYDDYDDYESNHYYYNDDDLYYKELYYERLNNILSKYDQDDYESRYYAKIYFELQQLDEEIHPWNYY